MVQFPNSEEVFVENNIWYWHAQAGENNKIISEKKEDKQRHRGIFEI